MAVSSRKVGDLLCGVAGGLAPAVVLARKERGQALDAERVGVNGAGVALQESARDRALELGEDPGRSGPEALKLGARLVGQRHASLHEILAAAGQRGSAAWTWVPTTRDPRGRGSAPGAPSSGRRRAQARGSGGGRFWPARTKRSCRTGRTCRPRPGTWAAQLRPGWVHSDHGVKQPLDQHPVRALDRHQRHFVAHERAAQRPQPSLVVGERGRQQLLARLVADEHMMLLGRPVDTRVVTYHLDRSSAGTSQRPDPEAPVRALIDRPSTGLRRVAACGTSPRWEGLVSRGPSHGQAPNALSQRRSRPTRPHRPRQHKDDQ